jgi:predicted transcriptional regulator
LEDGVLHALTHQADFTIKLLRLNRKQLVSYRINAFKQSAQSKQLTQLQDLTKMLKEVNRQLISLNLEQQKLLQEQNTLLRTILNMQEGDPTKWSS